MATTLNDNDKKILTTTRILGYVFALFLLTVVSLAFIPNTFFIVSTRAIVNAPVQLISSPIYGRLDKLDLQVGQAVASGDVMATVSNPNLDQTSLNGFRLERLDLAEKINNTHGAVQEREGRIEDLKVKTSLVRDAVLSELVEVIANSGSIVAQFDARLKEQDALLERQMTMFRNKLVNDISMEPQRQKRNAAQYELDAARGDLRRNEIIKDLITKGIYTGGPVTASLMALDMEQTKVAGEQSEDLIALRQMTERKLQLEKLVASEEGRLVKSGAADVVADYAGQLVSVEASYGDFVRQGQPVAKSLNCGEAFAAAVYPSREVESLEIGTPAMINYRSLGVKRSGKIVKMVRYFNSGSEGRYYAKFPEAQGHEVYVLIREDSQEGKDTAQVSNDKFFGCNVGEEVIVSLGESVVSRVSRYVSRAIADLSDAGSRLFSTASAEFASREQEIR
jgi:multidrug resistance efflux pump